MGSRAVSGPLGRVLGAGSVRSAHLGVVAAPVEKVWEALVALRWDDLPVGSVLMRLRGLGRVTDDVTCLDLFAPYAVMLQEAPRSCVLAMIGKPWSPVPRTRRVGSFDDFVAFDEPGWLRYGMEWCLTPTDDSRTLIETRTLCQPTSRSAAVLFRAYWTLIRAGSTLIRREMIAAIRNRAERES
ncbi:hypothetical protein EII34_10500 [Arachnia propionica]|uniref:Uncharacterized protein n=1 Tax=Arachnia propionica TaxID=1750 RepID=A0A3P1T406_9ACTN|nr:hypothetical protein [Arachnia propionica]RRD04257.1 hypothetical protein EII34_10500 [Arachnia propionica]